MIHTTVNGQTHGFEALHPDETAVELIRGRLGLTGTKLVCGSGVCGACTVLVDGTPMTSCLLPAHHLGGRQVRTIEHHGPENLHPVQRAFMMHDALQCGFCTPGFINSGIAFYETWRAEHPDETPDRETIASALAGNLCRCGAYPGIYRAMQRACVGDFDDGDQVHPPRYEALQKVTGRAKYTVDWRYENQLEGVILRSIHPHAEVISIDASPALALPGVVAFAELLPSDRKVRYVGQEIGALAAQDLRTARAALSKIEVQYRVLPAAVGPQAALEDDSPLVFTGLFRNPPTSAEVLTVPGIWQHNKRKNLLNITASAARKARGLIKHARESQDPYLIERTYHNNVQVHTTLEPHACLAKWEDPLHLTVHLSTQGVHHTAHAIAEHFDLEDENVHLISEHIGGGFGGKQRLSMEGIAAITLARLTERPVRVVLNRLEELSYAAYRPGAEVQLSLLTAEDSELRALSGASYGDSGVAIGSGVSLLVGGLSPDVPKDTEGYDVVNHTPPGKPFRGPDGPQALWALEQSIDEAAHHLGKDPIELRKAWYPDDPLRHKLLDWAADLPVWADRPASGDSGRFRRGVGLAIGGWPFVYHKNTQVTVGAAPDGFFVRTGTQDIGTGTRTLLASAVARVFGIAPHQVKVELGSSNAPIGPASGGSRVSNSVYGPATTAAQNLLDHLIQAARSQLDLRDPTPAEGGIAHAGGLLEWGELLAQTDPYSVTEERGSEPSLMFILDILNRDEHAPSIGQGNSLSVNVTEVLVDTRLGVVRPLGVWMGIAAGKIFLPTLARSQIEGGVVQGLGYALYEARQIDLQSGFNLTANLEDYKIPGIGDIPPIETYFLEEGFEHIRSQGIGIGELATVGVAASVGNAVFNATGWRPLNTPIRPQDVIEGVRS